MIKLLNLDKIQKKLNKLLMQKNISKFLNKNLHNKFLRFISQNQQKLKIQK